MQVKIEYQGKRDHKGIDWAHFAWLVIINGETFTYRTGLGHATQRPNYLRGTGKGNVKPKDKPVICLETEWVHIPQADDVLECLFSDASAGAVSFDDFCSDFGYSNDSLKALDTYRACMDAAQKLRKALGKEYETERQRIESKNA